MRAPLVRRPAGFTLIEVLITMVVTAIGLLTVAGLQASAKKASYEAAQRTVATALAQDMIERMRVNPSVKDSYVTGNSDVTNGTAASACDNSNAGGTPARVCTPAEIATTDLAQWGQKLKGSQEKLGAVEVGGLTNAWGCVVKGTGSYFVVVTWRGFSAVADPGDLPAGVDQCGKGLGIYTDPATGSIDTLRRLFWVELL